MNENKSLVLGSLNKYVNLAEPSIWPRNIWLASRTKKRFMVVGACFFLSILAGCSDNQITSGVELNKSQPEALDSPTSPEENESAIDVSQEDSITDSTSVPTAGGLTISYPNGGEKWKAGTSGIIKWSKGSPGATVKIQLLKGGKHFRWVTKKTANDGRYVWKIPSSVPGASSYQIKIVSLKNKKVFDKSDKTLKISAAKDALDLSKVTWLHTNVSRWPQTSTLTVTIKGGLICLNHTEKNSWPSIWIPHTSGKSRVKVNANPWVFVKRGGKWYGGTWEWMRTGSVCKGKYAVEGGHIKVSPLSSWKPRSGETLYFMVSALARSGKKNNFAARTNAVKVVWP
tara:strand:- start:292 stop:1317 length:1026 start_codon:yes stop_codon:yes gene_type:complete